MDDFYRSYDQTNSVKALKETTVMLFKVINFSTKPMESLYSS